MSLKNFSYKIFQGKEINDWILTLADLRIEIFKEWPYIYNGDLEYEKKYLSRYAQANKSMIAIAFDQNKVIGATSCIWLPEEIDLEIKKPFIDHQFNPHKIAYFGESLLKKDYRGQGIGSQFMKLREEFSLDICNANYAAFCSVVRPAQHPLKPKDYMSLENFWRSKGYTPQESMFCKMSWLDYDQKTQSEKKLQFWMKKLS